MHDNLCVDEIYIPLSIRHYLTAAVTATIIGNHISFFQIGWIITSSIK